MKTSDFKALNVLFVLIFFFTVALAKSEEKFPGEFSGEATFENRYYPSEGGNNIRQ